MFGELEKFSQFDEFLSELMKNVSGDMSGTFFITTDTDNAATISISNGKITNVTYSNKRGKPALDYFKVIKNCRARFSDQVVNMYGKAEFEISTDTFCRYLSANDEDVVKVKQEAITDKTSTKRMSDDDKEKLTSMAMNYMGPMGSIICHEVFESTHLLSVAIEMIAANLSESKDAETFILEARNALLL